MKVGILGSGDVGKALGKGFIARGHEVKIGTRETSKLDAWVKENGAKASSGSFADAAAFGELIVLAALGSAVEDIIGQAGEGSFDGKVIIDATNPLKNEPGKMPSLYVGHTDSLGEQIQRWLPKAKVVKAFNTVGNAYMVDPKFPGGPPDIHRRGRQRRQRKGQRHLQRFRLGRRRPRRNFCVAHLGADVHRVGSPRHHRRQVEPRVQILARRMSRFFQHRRERQNM